MSKLKKLINSIEKSITEGDINKTIISLKKLLDIDPCNYAALLELGNCLSKLKKFEEALYYYISANTLNNNNSTILNNIGITYLFLNNFQMAEKFLLKSIECDPENSQPYINLGANYDSQGRHQDNINISIKGISRWPNNELFHLNLGVALTGLNLFNEAFISFETTLLLKPKLIEARLNMASLFSKLGDNYKAIQIYENFIADEGNIYHERLNLVKYYLSYEYLSKGLLKKGWEMYASGFDCLIPSYLRRRPGRNFDVPEWNVSSHSQSIVLVWAEQGLGDELLFATMLPDQLELTPNVIFECDERLVPIFSRTYPEMVVRGHSYDELNFYKQKIHDFDFHIPIANLAYFHRDEIRKFPARSKTLKIDVNKKIKFKNLLQNQINKILIGICWRSGTLSPVRNSEYTSILDWGPIFSIPNACFVNLQYGECEEEIQQAEEKFNIEILRWSDIDLKMDIDDVMSLIDCLDIIVTASTAVFAMAGSLRKETYLYINKPGWDLLGTDYYPWFDTVKVFYPSAGEITASTLTVISNAIISNKKGVVI